MLITASQLYNDTYYFFYKQIKPIFFIAISVTFINIILDIFIKPDINIASIIENNQFTNSSSLLELISNMNLEEKYELLKYLFLKMLALLVIKTIFLGSIINLISTVSENVKKSIISWVYSLILFLPSLFVLNFMTTFIIQIGFMFLIIPGILLSIILSLSPIIFSFKKHSLIDSIRLSMFISWKNIKIIGPGILFWIFGKLFLTILFSHIDFINKNILYVLLNISINILFSILIIYLFRFYMIFLRSQNLNIV